MLVFPLLLLDLGLCPTARMSTDFPFPYITLLCRRWLLSVYIEVQDVEDII